jgi:hypothetical protein
LTVAGFPPEQVILKGLAGLETSLNVTLPLPGFGVMVAVKVTFPVLVAGGVMVSHFPTSPVGHAPLLVVTTVVVGAVVAGVRVMVTAGFVPSPITLYAVVVPKMYMMGYKYQVPLAEAELMP